MLKHFKQQSRLWDYTIIQKLGRGTSGEVFQVINKNNQQTFALKKMPIAHTQQKQKIQAFKQIKCLSLLSHPSIIQYKQSFLSMDNIYIVMQFASKGDFSNIIEERRKKQKFYTQNQLWNIFQQIIKGVKYLHQKSIIHRDLKLQNIFMTQDGKIKIGDLGMAKILLKDDQLISTRVGTPVYFAPQMIQNQLYSFPVDIWALGCVLYNLTTLQHPFGQASIQTLAYYAIQKEPKPIKGNYSIELINFISNCLQKDTKNRPNIFELAIKLKNRNKNQGRYNKISIFNIKHLNKILTGAAAQTKRQSSRSKNRFLQRQFSLNIYSPRKIHTSLNQRSRYDNQKQKTQNRNIRSSVDTRDFNQIKYFIESPQSPVLRNKLSGQENKINYQKRKLVGDNLDYSMNSTFIKSNGFSLQIENKLNQSPRKINDRQLNEFVQQKTPLMRKAFSRKSHR